jgi:putative ABC transport system permease protein
MKQSLRSWLWRVPIEQEVDDELAFHLEMRTRELIAEGLDPADARRKALERISSMSRLRRTCIATGRKRDREMRLTQWFEELRDDVRFALRQIRGAPMFALVAVLTLALGIGANSAIFALVDATLLRPLPFPDTERLVAVWERFGPFPRAAVSPSNFRDWSDRNHSFASMAAWFPFARGMEGRDGSAEQIPSAQVTAAYFDVLGVRAVAGRTFRSSDEAVPPNVVMFSESLWRARFGADPGLIGRLVKLDGQPFTVVGIVPTAFARLTRVDLWTVYTDLPGMDARALHFFQVVARLKPGVAMAAAQSDMTAIADALAREQPSTNAGRGGVIEPLRDAMIDRETRSTSLLFLAVVGFVLLMCCANVANLLLARITGRSRELAIRSAVGASRRRIVSQILTESLVIAAFGGVVGAALGSAIVEAAPSLMPEGLLPAAVTLAFDARVALFCAVSALVVGLLFGVVPAWQMTSASGVAALNSDSRTVVKGDGPFRRWLVAGQVASAVVLLCGAGLLLRTLFALEGVDPGFRARNVLSMSISMNYGLATSRYANVDALRRFFAAVEREVAALPGVRSVGWGSRAPLDGRAFGSSGFDIVGSALSGSNQRQANVQLVSPTFFETLDIPLVTGRRFTARDTAQSVQVCIVSETFARRYLQGESPVGVRIALPPMALGPTRPVVREVVGVVRQVKSRPNEPDDEVQIYVPIEQNAWSFTTLVVRPIGGEPETLTQAVRAAIARVDPQQPVTRIRTVDDIEREATSRPRFRAALVVAFATLALVLAMVGVFGVLAYSVEQRTREFGVRIALGASNIDVLRLVLISVTRVIATGGLIGLLAAAALGRLVTTFLFGVRAIDPLTFAAVATITAGTAVAAAMLPALRASRTDPSVAFRHE